MEDLTPPYVKRQQETQSRTLSWHRLLQAVQLTQPSQKTQRIFDFWGAGAFPASHQHVMEQKPHVDTPSVHTQVRDAAKLPPLPLYLREFAETLCAARRWGGKSGVRAVSACRKGHWALPTGAPALIFQRFQLRKHVFLGLGLSWS